MEAAEVKGTEMQTEGTRKPVRRLAGQRIVVLAVVAIVLVSGATTVFIYQRGGQRAGAESSASTVANESSAASSLPAGSFPQASASIGESTTSASPTSAATGLPVTLRKPRYPAHEPFVPTHSNETAGHATWSITNVQNSDGIPLAVSQSTDLSIVCAWTSPISVRPYFQQRVKVLGENADLQWALGSAYDGRLEAHVELSEDALQSDPGVEAMGYPLGYSTPIDPSDDHRVVTRSRGSVSGSITDRVAVGLSTIAGVPADSFVMGDIELAWDCGSAPTGVTGTYRPDPTGDAYFDIMDGKGFEDAVAVSGGNEIAMLRSGCGSGLGVDAVGDGGDPMCTANEDATPIPIPGYKPIAVLNAGSTIVIKAHGNWLGDGRPMTFTGARKSNTIQPQSDGYKLVYKLPAPGVYNCSVSVSWMDDLAWTFWSGYVFSIDVK
jgi:hypothetical protein